jgi:hypothetical protein
MTKWGHASAVLRVKEKGFANTQTKTDAAVAFFKRPVIGYSQEVRVYDS